MHVIKLVFLLLVFLLLYIYACMSIMQHVTPLVCFIYIYIYIHTICGYSIYIYIYIYHYISCGHEWMSELDCEEG